MQRDDLAMLARIDDEALLMIDALDAGEEDVPEASDHAAGTSANEADEADEADEDELCSTRPSLDPRRCVVDLCTCSTLLETAPDAQQPCNHDHRRRGGYGCSACDADEDDLCSMPSLALRCVVDLCTCSSARRCS